MTETHTYTNHEPMVVDTTNHTPHNTINGTSHTQYNTDNNTNHTDVTNELDDTKESHHHSTSNIISLAQQRKCKLKFFRNQVAGHNALLWDSGTVCKPLIPAEYDFYSTIETESPTLIPYVPKYYGIMSVDKTVVNDATDQFELSVDDINNASCAIHNNSDRPSSADDAVPSQPNDTVVNHISNDDNFTYNRWAYKCLQQKMKKDKQKQSKHNINTPQSTHRQYIVLEDLTFAYSKPSILDLKLGTRQHGEHDSPAKIESKMQRCAATTSGSIGLRLCGMQVYKPAQQRNIYRDKYYGRSLDVQSFKQSLKEYFWNGTVYRTDVMHAFIQRLTEFRQALIENPKYRFYSSSLLLVYEGLDDISPASTSPTTSPTIQSTENNTQSQPTTIDLNDTDMNNNTNNSANTLMPPPQTSLQRSMPSNQSSALTHSQSMPISLQPPTTNTHTSSNHTDTDINANNKVITPHTNTLQYNTYPFLQNRPPPKIYARKRKTTHAQAKERARLRGGIDVRIIDFAHTIKVSEHSSQQDSGLLLGFTNLINFIQELLEQAERQHKRSSSDVSTFMNSVRPRQTSHHDLTTIVEAEPDDSNDSKLLNITSSRQLWRSESDMSNLHTHTESNNDFKHTEQQELHA